MLKYLIKKIKSFGLKTYIRFNEKCYKEVKYLHVKNNSSDLLVLFSGFNPNNKRSYNYIRSLKRLKCDKLYILDTWGYKGSYYWYDKGNNKPEIICCELIKKMIYNYKHFYTGGTSKGGTAAIYYGLLLGADMVFSGANQYFIGNYLSHPSHIDILNAMMGGANNVDCLNIKLRKIIEEKKNTKTVVNLLYSKIEKEGTYQTDMAPMIKDLNQQGIMVVEDIQNFENHNDVGLLFPSFVLKHMP